MEEETQHVAGKFECCVVAEEQRGQVGSGGVRIEEVPGAIDDVGGVRVVCFDEGVERSSDLSKCCSV